MMLTLLLVFYRFAVDVHRTARRLCSLDARFVLSSRIGDHIAIAQ